MAGTTTLILGGGFGGLAVARTLRPLVPSQHRVVLIDRDADFCAGAVFPWVMMGHARLDAFARPRAGILPGGVEFVRSEIETIDLEKGLVRTRDGEFRGDHIVLALGAALDMDGIPGLARSAYTFFTAEGAIRAAPAVRDFRGGDLVILVTRAPFRCPPAPYEVAMSLHYDLMERDVLGSTRISVYTAEPAPMPTAGPEMGALIRGEIERRGIAYHPRKKAVAIHDADRTIEFEDGGRARFDLLLTVPPHVAPPVIAETGLTNASGWIPVNPHTLELAESDGSRAVYAIGDITALPLPGYFDARMPLSLPKAGTFAANEGDVVGRRIAARILGRESNDRFDGTGFCFLETGGGTAMRADGSFFDLPHPHMRREAPSSARFREKQEWVRGLHGA